MKYNNVHVFRDGERVIFSDLNRDNTKVFGYTDESSAECAFDILVQFVEFMKSRKEK